MWKRIRIYFLTNLSKFTRKVNAFKSFKFFIFYKNFFNKIVHFLKSIKQWESRKFKLGVYNRVENQTFARIAEIFKVCMYTYTLIINARS